MRIEYVQREEDGEPLCCDSCNCPAPTSEFNWAPASGPHDRPTRALCEFCSSTMGSRYTEYPAREDFTALRAEIWRAAGAVFNMLRRSEPKPQGAAVDSART